jgi:acyl-CoA synthetase (AMP-forming)/AMP-acid ligase II
MTNILYDIEAAAAANPDSVAIRRGSATISYAQLLKTINAVARAAIADGAKPGDRFVFGARPSPESVAYTLGMLRAGLTLVFVDPFSAPELFETRVRMVEPRYVMADSLLYLIGSNLLAPVRRARRLQVCNYAQIPNVRHLRVGGWLPGVPLRATSMSGWAAGSASQRSSGAAAAPPMLPILDEAQDAIVTFTSGTTGNPKGVVHNLATISANASNFAAEFGVTRGSLVYAEPMTLGVVALANGATWQIPLAKEALPSEIDVLFAVPADLLDLLEKVAKPNDTKPIDANPHAPKVRVVGTGAAPVLPTLIERVSQVLGDKTKFINVYGMTEMLPVATCSGEEKQRYLEDGNQGDLVGHPMGDTRIRIAADSEVEVSGSGLMNRYWGQESRQWHPTGDLGKLLPDGSLVLLGRKKNMLIRRNMNIYPSLYEPGLCTIPGVADAAIIGVPDEYGDDRVMLFVVAEPGRNPQEVLAMVRANVHLHMDADSLPDRIELIDEIPLSGRARKRDTAALVAEAARYFPKNRAG